MFQLNYFFPIFLSLIHLFSPNCLTSPHTPLFPWNNSLFQFFRLTVFLLLKLIISYQFFIFLKLFPTQLSQFPHILLFPRYHLVESLTFLHNCPTMFQLNYFFSQLSISHTSFLTQLSHIPAMIYNSLVISFTFSVNCSTLCPKSIRPF